MKNLPTSEEDVDENVNGKKGDRKQRTESEKGQPSEQSSEPMQMVSIASEVDVDTRKQNEAGAQRVQTLLHISDREIYRQQMCCLATILRAEHACQVIASRSDYLEGLGRLTLLPPNHMTGWGWDAREYVNKLHDRAAVAAAERLPLSAQSSVLYIGGGNPAALFTLCARMRWAARVREDATIGNRSRACVHCGSLAVTDHDERAVRWTAKQLGSLMSKASENGLAISLVVAAKNPIPPRHPDGRALTQKETMAMDPDVYDMSYRELQALVRDMFREDRFKAIHGQDLTANAMELQQAIMRARRDATWGLGATAHSHLPFRAATFDGIIVHPSGRHLQQWPLSELRRVLRPGGCLVIPARKWPLQIEPPSCASPFLTSDGELVSHTTNHCHETS
eukprot:SAG31_NODE_7299_length_1727_cov_1.763514_1_plen_394_part_00